MTTRNRIRIRIDISLEQVAYMGSRDRQIQPYGLPFSSATEILFSGEQTRRNTNDDNVVMLLRGFIHPAGFLL